MDPNDIIPILLLIARPAAGKSEIIHYLKQTESGERRRRFHIGPFEEIDDFPMLWSWFEEDDILSEMGMHRLHSTPDGYFLDNRLWNVLIRRISLEYAKRQRDPSEHQKTTIIEFSRGTEHGGYREAFDHLSPQILERAAILYIDVSYEESRRKNRARFNPERPDSILEHGLSDDKMERLYRETDWDPLAADSPECLTIQGFTVPYAVFDNHDDVTTHPGPALGERLEQTLGILWARYKSCRS